MRSFWLAFLAVQFAGLLGSVGVEIFHQGPFGFACHLIAVVLLEPGLILARAIIDKFYWERFSSEELFRYASVFGALANAIFAIWARAFFKALRPQRDT
jgi:hypothetical protein